MRALGPSEPHPIELSSLPTERALIFDVPRNVPARTSSPNANATIMTTDRLDAMNVRGATRFGVGGLAFSPHAVHRQNLSSRSGKGKETTETETECFWTITSRPVPLTGQPQQHLGHAYPFIIS